MGAGCYAELGPVAWAWADCELTLPELLAELAKLPVATLYRHNVAGDLEHDRGSIREVPALDLAETAQHLDAWLYTHHVRSTLNLAVLVAMHERGMTVNLSTDSLRDADQASEDGCGLPVVVTVPSDHPAVSTTPGGRTVVVCPAQTRGLTCRECRLCLRPRRRLVVGFRAHGSRRGMVDARLRGAA